MPEDALTFESLRIRRMHGFRPPGLRVRELSPGVNIVYGPNASGKSTLARALYRLLWPESGGDRESIVGIFELEGSQWRVELDAGRVVYQRDGRDAAPPDLPPEDRNGQYHLYLHELLDDTNREFARSIQQAARGGYDITEAAAELEFTEPAPRSGDSTRRVEELDRRVEERERDLRGLRDDERRLDRLREELRGARDARERLDLLEDVRAHARYRAERREAERAFEQFPDVLERVEGDERERVEQLDEKIEARRSEIRDAERRRRRAQQRLEESAIPEEGLPEGLLGSLDERRRELRETKRELQQFQSDLERARAAAGSEWEKLRGAVDRERAGDLDLSGIEDLAAFARDAQEVDARRALLERLEEAFGDAEAPDDARLDTLREAVRHLQRWRGFARREDTGRPSRARRAVVVSALAVGASGIALAITVHPGWLALLAVAGLLAFAAYLLVRDDSARRRRRDHRRAFEDLEVEGPDDWMAADVERRVDELTRRLAELAAEADRAAIRDEFVDEHEELAEREREIDARREALADRTGLAPQTAPTVFRLFVDQLRSWQEARREVSEHRARLERVRDRRKEQFDALVDQLEPFTDRPADDTADLEGQLQALRDAKEDFREAERERNAAQDALEDAREELSSVRAERERIFEELELEPGDRAELADLCSQLEDYQEARQEFRDAESRAEAERRELEERDGFEPSLLEWSPADLDRAIEDLRDDADRVEELHEDVTRLENDLDRARSSHDLEEALADYREAREALRRERERDVRRAVGAALASFIRQKTRDRQLPEVFHRARELFSAITRGRYRLLFDEGDPPEFRANDEVLQRGFALDELSEGTRVQLLLAVRIAFLETREDGSPLPVVFDETLATSDDERAEALIRSIARIASRGRQIFYLTAQRDEAVKWHAHLEGSAVAHQFVRLDTADDDAPDAGRWRPEAENPVPSDLGGAPRPRERSHDAYAESLEIPDWSPRQPVGAVHLWYLVEDPERLYECLDAGVSRWGQLRHLRDAGGLGAVGIDGPTFARIRARARALEAYRDARAIGRGDPVDRGVLEASGAVTENFIDEVADLCERVEGDAEAIIEGLEAGEVSGFLSKKRDELETYFRREGYISGVEPLPREQLWERTLAACAEDLESGSIDRGDLARLFERIAREAPTPEAVR